MTEAYRIYHIAKLYYVDGLTQSEIARRLSISSMSVCRMLKRAEEEGVVTIQLRAPMKLNQELSRKLRKHYRQLSEAIVISEEDPRKLRQRIGEASAQHVMDLLQPNMIIGLSWGRAIGEFVTCLQHSNHPGIKVVQLSGEFLFENDFLMVPSSLIKQASERLGSDALFLSAPMFVSTPEMKNELMQDRKNRFVLDQAQKSMINVIGLSPLNASSTVSKVGIISPDDRQELQEAGAIGDVVGFFIDKDGNEVDWSKRSLYMGVDLAAITSAPNVVCLASGKEKAQVTEVAIRRKYINTLVTTDELALALLE